MAKNAATSTATYQAEMTSRLLRGCIGDSYFFSVADIYRAGGRLSQTASVKNEYLEQQPRGAPPSPVRRYSRAFARLVEGSPSKQPDDS